MSPCTISFSSPSTNFLAHSDMGFTSTVLTQLSKLFLLKLSMVIDSKHIFFFFLLQSFLNSQWHLTPVNYFSFLKLFFSRFSEAPMLFLLAFILFLSCLQTPLFKINLWNTWLEDMRSLSQVSLPLSVSESCSWL